MWDACRGGTGGDGGRGGDAGGGLGGPSCAVASIAAHVSFGPDAALRHGGAGDGGLAGNAASPEDDEGKGARGEAQAWCPFDVPAPEPPR
ncbi:hypothetical protein BE08_32295 [Sorangium cellulosum]|uniref:PE-PGRS family protein n=1 Tax=Sorangium cellulosum TaxID=56 RepID=A0A150PGF3_SORCE|nr:hypothetical protein BE08_32295 [Sorangium cellulosum]